jgi:hypothetical protein
MTMDMPESRLNEPEHGLQHSFMKSRVFNGLLMGVAVLAAYLPIRALPDHRPLPVRTIALKFQAVSLPETASPLRLAGAWVMTADDPRFGGLSALATDGNGFLAVSDLGAVIRFDRPSAAGSRVWLADLTDGPGPAGRKTSRDAESLARDPRGMGWWVGYEQRHSLWLYDKEFRHARTAIRIERPNWWRNRGIEGLTVTDGELLALAENGREAIAVGRDGQRSQRLYSAADVAEAARAPDGGNWVLLRQKAIGGIAQSVALLKPTHDGYRVGPAFPVPKASLDNYEGMAIESRPDGRWRFWLVSDDGHRLMARTLLVALDLDLTVRNKKSPARNAGLSE